MQEERSQKEEIVKDSLKKMEKELENSDEEEDTKIIVNEI